VLWLLMTVAEDSGLVIDALVAAAGLRQDEVRALGLELGLPVETARIVLAHLGATLVTEGEELVVRFAPA
jgi:hypothetical protein